VPLLNPLIKKIVGKELAPPENVEYSYNKVVLLAAIIIATLTAITQYFKYKQGSSSYTYKKIIVPTLLALLTGSALFIFYPIRFLKHEKPFLITIYIALFAAIYAATANAGYIWVVLKGKMRSAGGSLSHFGFALMLIGMIISSANKKVITDSRVNGIMPPLGQDPMSKQQEDPLENLTMIRDLPTRLYDYEVTYLRNVPTHERTKRVYELLFRQKNEKGGITEEFTLRPDVYTMKDKSISSNPDTRNFWNKDVFTYITATPGIPDEDTATYRTREMQVGEKVFYRNGYFILEGVEKNPKNNKFDFKETDAALMANVTVVTKDSLKYHLNPLLFIKDNELNFVDDTAFSQSLYFHFAGVSDTKKIKLAVKESDKVTDFITIKSFVFPYIGLVWVGLITMVGGISISLLNRIKASNTLTMAVLLAIIAALVRMFIFGG
jgi:cytochrome c-type biogenesis protein CcmF